MGTVDWDADGAWASGRHCTLDSLCECGLALSESLKRFCRLLVVQPLAIRHHFLKWLETGSSCDHDAITRLAYRHCTGCGWRAARRAWPPR
eukprot:7381181-Prymnesium_polylepis.1